MGIHHRAVVLGETLLYSTCTLCKQVSSPRYARRAEGASQPQGLVLFHTYPILATWMEMNVGGHHFCPEALLASRGKKNHGELSDVWSFRHDSLGKRPNVPFGVICWYPPAPPPPGWWRRSQVLLRGFQGRGRKWRNQPQLPH